MENLMQEMLRILLERGIDKTEALRALRALSKWFGGQQLYIPQKRDTELSEEIFGVLADEVGDGDAEMIYDIISTMYGGVQWYIPVENNAFRDIIAQEIRQEYDGTTQSMRALCRKYNVSYSQIYRLFYEGQNTGQKEFNF